MTRTDELRAFAAREVRLMSVPVTELRAEQDNTTGNIIIRGHAAVFDRLSEELPLPYGTFREKIARGAFRKALDAGQDVRALINHNDYPVLGRTKSGTLDLREDPRGLHAWITAPDTEWARDLRSSMNRGDIDQMSFGFSVEDDVWEIAAEGTDDEQITRTVREVGRLYDVSVVTFPAYPQTDANARALAEEETPPPPAAPEELDSDVPAEGADGSAGDGDTQDSPDDGERSFPVDSWRVRRVRMADHR